MILSSNSEEFIMKEHLTESLIKELIQITSEDTLIHLYTSDLDRFSNVASFDRWLKKGKTLYPLVDKQEKLAGIVWFGRKLIPLSFEGSSLYETTVAIRLYKKARGVGVALPFLSEASNAYRQTAEYKSTQKGIWLIVSKTNEPAIRLYKRSGYIQKDELKQDGKLLLTKDHL